MLDGRSFALVRDILWETKGIRLQYWENSDGDLSLLDMGIRAEMSGSEKIYDQLREAVASLDFGKIRILRDQLCLDIVLFRADEDTTGFYVLGPFREEYFQKLEDNFCKRNRLDASQIKSVELLMQRVPAPFPLVEALTIAKNILFSAHGLQEPQIEEVDLTEHALPPISLVEDMNSYALHVEERWAHEEQLLQAIREGNEPKALEQAAYFLHSNTERRLNDRLLSVRSLTYSVNTLFCRVVHSVGVHPLFCDEISKSFARKLELCATVEQIQELHTEMIHEYCLLSNSYRTQGYSENVRRIIHYVQLNLGQQLSVESMAQKLNFSKGYLSHSFKKQMGITIKKYINRQRVELAARLLKETHLSIREIADHVGLPDWNYFTKVFRQEKGCTPSQFRKQSD